jgi:uncharacterized protein (TIGR02145 family)
MQRDKIKAAALAVMLVWTTICTSQIFDSIFKPKKFRPYNEEIFYMGHSYRAVEVAEQDEYYNVYWKKWMIDDIRPFEADQLMDMKTQKEFRNEGYFVNPIVDSAKFNHSAAMKVCPAGWRLPRVGEYDTLMSTITKDQRSYMFRKLEGFKGYSADTSAGIPMMKRQMLKGGFWWCQETDTSKARAFVVKVGENCFYEVGMADIKDLASVRCVQDDYRIKSEIKEND